MLRECAVSNRALAGGMPLIGDGSEGLCVDDLEVGCGGADRGLNPLCGDGRVLERIGHHTRVHYDGTLSDSATMLVRLKFDEL